MTAVPMNIAEATAEWVRRRRRFYTATGQCPIALIRRRSWPAHKLGCENGLSEMILWTTDRRDPGHPTHGCVLLDFPEDLVADDWEVVDFPLGTHPLYEDPENIRPEEER